MNTPTLKALLGLLAAALLAGCGVDSASTDYFPLAPGLNWQYRLVRSTMDGTAELRHAITARAPGREGIAGVRVSLSGATHEYVRDDDGLHRVKNRTSGTMPEGSAVEKSLVLPSRPQTGTRWQSVSATTVLENSGPPWETLFRVNVTVPMTYEVESMQATIETPAGTFSRCMVIRGHGATRADIGSNIGITNVSVSSREWFAPGVGLVRMERTESSSVDALKEGSLVMELDTVYGY